MTDAKFDALKVKIGESLKALKFQHKIGAGGVWIVKVGGRTFQIVPHPKAAFVIASRIFVESNDANVLLPKAISLYSHDETFDEFFVSSMEMNVGEFDNKHAAVPMYMVGSDEEALALLKDTETFKGILENLRIFCEYIEKADKGKEDEDN